MNDAAIIKFSGLDTAIDPREFLQDAVEAEPVIYLTRFSLVSKVDV